MSNKAGYDQYGAEMGFLGCSTVFVISIISLVIGLFMQDNSIIIPSLIFAIFAAMGVIFCYCCVGYNEVLFKLEYKGKIYTIKEKGNESGK
jgi:hypothetical protein